jgi:hypothetical protein
LSSSSSSSSPPSSSSSSTSSSSSFLLHHNNTNHHHHHPLLLLLDCLLLRMKAVDSFETSVTTAQHPRRLKYLTAPLWEPQISRIVIYSSERKKNIFNKTCRQKNRTHFMSNTLLENVPYWGPQNIRRHSNKIYIRPDSGICGPLV